MVLQCNHILHFQTHNLWANIKNGSTFFGRAKILVFGVGPSFGVANICCNVCVGPTLMLNVNFSEDMHCTVQVHVFAICWLANILMYSSFTLYMDLQVCKYMFMQCVQMHVLHDCHDIHVCVSCMQCIIMSLYHACNALPMSMIPVTL